MSQPPPPPPAPARTPVLALRLPHVLAAMALILLAGVVSVRYLEERMGGATVPGLVIADMRWVSGTDLRALSQVLPGAVAEVVDAAPGVLGPFSDDLFARLAGRGDRTSLFSLDPALAAERDRPVGEPWHEVHDVFPEVGGVPAELALASSAAAFVRAQRSTRAFLTVLAFGAGPANDLERLVGPLVLAAQDLPSFRRSAIVVLGGPAGDGRRHCLRLDLGPWGDRAEPLLADLLEARW